MSNANPSYFQGDVFKFKKNSDNTGGSVEIEGTLKVGGNNITSSGWAKVSVASSSPSLTLADSTIYQFSSNLISITLTADANVEIGSIIKFTSGQTATTLTLAGSTSILFTGDHTASGILTPQSYFDYVIRFIAVGSKIVGSVSAVSSLTETAVSGASASITAASGNYYKCSEPLTSLVLTLTGFTSGKLKIDFTAGNSTTLTGLSGITMVGADCADGVFTPISGRAYTLILTASTGTIKGEVSIQGVSSILPLLLVSAPTGTLVTASNGTTTLNAVIDDGMGSLYLPSTGPWTISGTFGAISSDNTASITAQDGATSYVTLTFSSVKVYGVRIYKNNTSPVLERLGDAAGLEFTPKKAVENSDGTITTTQTGFSDFDNLAIFKDIKTCVLNNGAVVAYEGEEGFSYTPTTGDVVTEFPKYYLKAEDTTTMTTIWVSNAKGAGFVTSPAHADRGDGAGERDKVYIGRYLSNSSFRSVSNTSGSNYTDKIASFRTGYSSRGSGYYNFGYCEYMTLAYLYLIETANLNSQTSVGFGVTTGTANPQGESDSLGYHSGVLQKWDSATSANVPENRSSVLYRGIENIWGNTQYFLDGARYINGYLAYCINPLLYVSTETGKDNYKLIKGTVFYPSVTYITSMIWDTDTETQWAMGVGGYSASGSSSTYWCDTFRMLKVSEIVVLGVNTEDTNPMNSGFWSHRYAAYNPSTETDCSRMVYLGQ